MSQRNTKIFRIVDKKTFPNYISFHLHTQERIACYNKFPFSTYKVGDHLGINLDGWDGRPTLGDTDKVFRVVYRPPQFYQKEIINDPNFGDGWVEE